MEPKYKKPDTAYKATPSTNMLAVEAVLLGYIREVVKESGMTHPQLMTLFRVSRAVLYKVLSGDDVRCVTLWRMLEFLTLLGKDVDICVRASKEVEPIISVDINKEWHRCQARSNDDRITYKM